MKINYFYFKCFVMMLAFFLVQTTVANNRLRAILPTTTASCTYEFYNGDELVQTQIVLNGEKLLIPAIPQPKDSAEPSGAFIGWFEEGATEAFSFSNPITVTETKTVKLRARYSDKVYVHFIVKSINEEAGLKVATTKEVKKGETVNVDDIPIIYPDGKKLKHWTLTLDAEGNGTAYDFATAVTKNISLYAVYEPAWRVYFRMRGGKSILPRYYSDKEQLNPSGQITPFRAGYDFKGWTTVDSGATLDDAIIENFNNGDEVTMNLELYAIWNKGTANYKVAHWQQNADNNEYSFVEIDEKSGITESEAEYVAKEYTGFVLNADKTNGLKPKIDGFGTTVKHVFYDRLTYTLSFTKGTVTYGPFQGIRYGAKTDKSWNEVAEANEKHLFYVTVKENDKDKILYYTHPPRMPNKDLVVMIQETAGKDYIVYYKDKGTDNDLLSPFEFQYTEKDNKKLTIHRKGLSVAEGFEEEDYADDEIPQFNPNADKTLYTATRYFIRNKYKITFFKKNGDSEAVAGDILFEGDLSEKALAEFKKGETTREDNFIFGGWFTAEETQDEAEEFVFENKKMPAHNIVLYAKWLKPTYKVYFHPNNDITSDSYAELQYEHNAVIPESDAQAKVSALTDPTLFFKWFWYPASDRYVRYDFGMPITEDIHLYPTWSHPGFKLTYALGAGTGTVPVDENIYFVAKDAVVKAADGIQAPEGKVFVGWKAETTDDSKLYAPGEKIAVVGNLTLTAQWQETPQSTSITYMANGGVESDITEELMNNETHVTKVKETFTKDKQEIKSWNTKSDGGGDSFEFGVSIIVNNSPGTPNVLYAIWGNITGVNTLTSNLTIKYYPNPVLTTLTIEGEQRISRVEILDALGKFVRVLDTANSKYLEVDFSNLNVGLYYVRVFSDEGKSVFKVMKK